MSMSPSGGGAGRKFFGASRGLKETLSSDEELFYDSNNLNGDADDIKSNPETDDEFFDPQDGGMMRSRRKSSDADSTRPNSPLYVDAQSKPYTNLRSLAGLSSALSNQSLLDETTSQKESVVSSLSSTSHDHEVRSGSNSKEGEPPAFDLSEDHGRRAGMSRKLGYRGSGGGNGGGSSPTAAIEQDPNVKQMLDDAQVFQHIFSSLDIGPTVRVTGTYKAGKGAFKDKVRLVQTLEIMHDGPVWVMKFSPNGHYLATGGQDAKVIVWCVAEIPKTDNASNNHHNNHHPMPPVPPQSTGNASSNVHNGNMSSSGPSAGGQPPPILMDPSRHEGMPPSMLGAVPTYATQNQEIDGTNHVIGYFLLNEPYRILEGHTADITDLSWSRSSFLLSASMDHFVRLWHVSKRECLQEFKHPDAVTSVEFNPLHDRYFVSGCFDRRIRVWDIIPDGQVREWAQAPDTVTAVTVSPDGQTVVAGLIQGQIFFYEYEGMRYKTQMDCRNRSGKYKNGCKVTGLSYLWRGGDSSGGNSPTNSTNINALNNNSSHNNGNNSTHSGGRGGAMSHLLTASFPPRRKMTMVSHGQLLVTTNDHRIRLCRLDDYSVISKYKGLKNKAMQIKATTSEDGKYIICGSDSGDVFLWRTHEPKNSAQGSNDSASTNNHGGGGAAHLLFTFDKVYKNREYETFDGCDSGNGSSTAAGGTIGLGGGGGAGNASSGFTSVGGGGGGGGAAAGNRTGGNRGGDGSGDYYGSVSVICAVFAPVESMRRYLRSQHGLLLKLKEQAAAANAAAQLLGIPANALGFGRKLPHPAGNTGNANSSNSNTGSNNLSAAEQFLGRRTRHGSAASAAPDTNNTNNTNNNLSAAYDIPVIAAADPRLMMTDLSSRVVITADTDGMLRVYYRMC